MKKEIHYLNPCNIMEKKELLAALRLLIAKYRNAVKAHKMEYGIANCPLCVLYLRRKTYTDLPCMNCPNRLFKDETNSHGCTVRSYDYFLSFTDVLDFSNCLKFWIAVIKRIYAMKGTLIREEVQKVTFEEAQKYKKL